MKGPLEVSCMTKFHSLSSNLDKLINENNNLELEQKFCEDCEVYNCNFFALVNNALAQMSCKSLSSALIKYNLYLISSGKEFFVLY